MAKTVNMEKWGRKTARERYAEGGSVVAPDPDTEDSYDRTGGRSGPAYPKGSRAALDEALHSAQAEDARNDPAENKGAGPLKYWTDSKGKPRY